MRQDWLDVDSVDVGPDRDVLRHNHYLGHSLELQ